MLCLVDVDPCFVRDNEDDNDNGDDIIKRASSNNGAAISEDTEQPQRVVTDATG